MSMFTDCKREELVQIKDKIKIGVYDTCKMLKGFK